MSCEPSANGVSPDITTDSLESDCPFCGLPMDRVVAQNEAAVAIADAFPVSPGHTLIIPRRHVRDFFDTTSGEVEAIFGLLHEMRARLVADRRPDGFNVGINCGVTAGQTVMHAHVHLIPRYAGDRSDPTGGVRNVIADLGHYG